MTLDKRINHLRTVYRGPEPEPVYGIPGALTMHEEYELDQLLAKIEQREGLTATERVRCNELVSRWENRATTCEGATP